LNWKTFFALLGRDAHVARRNFIPIVLQTLLQTMLLVFVFGRLVTTSGYMPIEYKSMLLPGIIALSMLLSGIQAVAMPLISEFQFTREIEEATEAKPASRPLIIRWAVPNDDALTTNFELAQVDPAWRLTPEQVAQPGFGQSGDRPYAERQRFPADFDAQSSQRTIAVHDLEHLASTDRGVIMLRRILRDGIRAVARGEDPFGATCSGDKAIRTFTQDVVLRVPAAPTPEEDRRLLRATGRRVLA